MKPYQRKGKKIMLRNLKKANAASKKKFMQGEWRSGSRSVGSMIKKYQKFDKKFKSPKNDTRRRAFWKFF